MKTSLKQAIDQIKGAGFSHIKVELEANLGRDGEQYCDNCQESGRVDCDNCDGEGYVESGDYTQVSRDAVLVECVDCYGEGRTSCYDCDGSGYVGAYRDEDDCYQFMLDFVPTEVRDRLVYGKFYNDGSVDSEFTFTLHADHIEDVLEWMKAFTAIADDCGGEVDVSDAGLHITVLPEESDGNYPIRGHNLRSANVRNFTTEMTKLMPALFFLASPDHRSRALGYRHPRVDEDKYSAISTHYGTCFEFRVFETCYDKPEAFYDYIKTIANCLKFYADPSLKVSTIGKEFGFTEGHTLERFFNTPEQLRILNATIKHIKPTDKTYKELRTERQLNYTIKTLVQKEKQKVGELKEEYKKYRENHDNLLKQPLTERQQRTAEMYRQDGATQRQAERYARGIHSNRVESMTEFIRANLRARRYEETVSV